MIVCGRFARDREECHVGPAPSGREMTAAVTPSIDRARRGARRGAKAPPWAPRRPHGRPPIVLENAVSGKGPPWSTAPDWTRSAPARSASTSSRPIPRSSRIARQGVHRPRAYRGLPRLASSVVASPLRSEISRNDQIAGLPEFRTEEWSQHSDLNRGPAVYEVGRPKRCGMSVESRA
jgi:hypothetical protein